MVKENLTCLAEENYIVGKYGYEGYPANPNGSDYNTAMLCDSTGRSVMMPHIERSNFQWNWANYPADRNDEVSPWHEAFVNAKKWIDKNNFFELKYESVPEKERFFMRGELQCICYFVRK
jgi:phosphoribosylformylglycinamidine (FGAM) synthase-like amidotransferase family enzyme